jgi:hypothetical protein
MTPIVASNTHQSDPAGCSLVLCQENYVIEVEPDGTGTQV